jgi:phosphomethylpyrimidine synthase
MKIDCVLRHPLSGSKKIYVPGELYSEIRVPMREIALTNGKTLTTYDTSGDYTQSEHPVDIASGLRDLRSTWIAKRNDTEKYTGRNIHAKDNGYQEND